ncbi:MAG TPA: FAD-dependent oxidoreductase [Candidatus Limnocylindrales bacterium]|nr:FAD-dependent oxidoreductase [Candidatus Limnocylindrales bacterium]
MARGLRGVTLPDQARVVIVGGGVGGLSIAYHLADRGVRDVLVLERAQLTSGSTFHSAGLVGQLRSSLPLTRMMMDSVDLYRRLKTVTGHDPGWREVGSLRLASTPQRLEELQRQAGWGKSFGLPIELVDAVEAARRFPLMRTDGVLGAAFIPTDGYLDPSGLALALAEGARRQGVRICEGVRVTGIALRRGAVSAVETPQGAIACEVLVDAGGIYADEIARMAGVSVPVVAMAHQYLIARLAEPVPDDLPTMRDPDLLVYFRREPEGLVMGGYERNPASFGLEGIPGDFNNRLLPPDWDRFAPLSENAVKRVPALERGDVVRLINGPEAFTPDNEFILGPSSVRGLFVAAGFCAHGIAGAGGMGRQVAAWIVDGEPELDLWKMDIRRFPAHHASQSYTLARTVEVYSTYYDIHYPNEERQAGRPLRTSPTYVRLTSLHASFGEKSGWERPNWFDSNAGGADGVRRPSGWAGVHWSPAIAAEHRATRERAGLFDETSFAKLAVEGPGALGFLQRLCANDIDRPVGSVVYTQMLNTRGGIECDFTVTRLEADAFAIVTGTAFGAHDAGWIAAHLPDDGSVRLTDETSRWACLGLWGPRAREILQPLTDTDLSNAAFPYLTARHLLVEAVPCLALRVTYVGELGWELYCPSEYGLRLWDTLVAAGRGFGLTAAGYRAIESLRLEKGYRVWSSDITPADTPDEAGLAFAVRVNKPVDFIGKAALLRKRAEGVRRRLRPIVLDDPEAIPLGGEPVRAGDAVVSRVTSGGFGYTLAASIAYAYLPAGLHDPDQEVEVEIFGRWVAARVKADPLYDPSGSRIRA